MPWILTVTSQTGQKVNIVTGSSTDSAAIYDEDELNQRIREAKNDPRDLVINVRRVSTTEA